MCKEQTQNSIKTDQKTSFLGLRGDTMKLKSRPHPLERYIPTYKILNPLAQFGGKIGEEKHVFNVKKGKNLYISSPNKT